MQVSAADTQDIRGRCLSGRRVATASVGGRSFVDHPGAAYLHVDWYPRDVLDCVVLFRVVRRCDDPPVFFVPSSYQPHFVHSALIGFQRQIPVTHNLVRNSRLV